MFALRQSAKRRLFRLGSGADTEFIFTFGLLNPPFLSMLNRFYTLLCCCIALSAGAQDLHYSQFYHNPMHGSPALTGSFSGDFRVMGLYRNQWASVPVPYSTVALGADKKMLEFGGNIVAAGLLVQHDKAGDAGLTWTQVGLSGSVSRALNAQHTVSVGFGAALAQRRFDISGLKFRGQWTGDVYNPALPNNETFDQSSGMVPSLSAGLAWRLTMPDPRTEASVGIGAFHLNQPTVGFRDDSREALPMRLSVLANSTVRLNQNLDAVVFGEAWQMGAAQETLLGGGARMWLAPGERAMRFTLATRLGDAIIPAVQYEFGDWTVGLSYDWNTSDFETATNGRGGMELAVVYRAQPVPPPKQFKSCPIF
ncbi:MAG: PorP/SprF family type IX secretion system membrane protein [Saprospiraceae bacterium]|nr:PorP/SprF family type IX secretion system membrane protein [Saprospiraceae bacterium]